MPLPDFTSPTTFKTFNTIPSTLDSTAPSESYYLLAEIKENLSLTRPTLICSDLSSTSFALTWSELNASPHQSDVDFKALGLKKGNCILLPNAKRTDSVDEGKQGKVVIPGGKYEWEAQSGLKVIPGKLEKVVEVGQDWEFTVVEGENTCGNCGKEGEELAKCTGCRGVGYCSKECQVKGWTEGGHKSVCKIIKSFKETWP
ncbi:hypothetical protein QBC40DRAFT_282113 [Triangularia verruculosa]|uniref:MYND-type domain-containing protein n=1 Tax=Triangularia verruculosa TaxID=2587418 RepID=A0AAN7AVV2_9PEZI|nr:hypothetical protein QBC40DRAFT_282113 [Triangularia verruculosa]